MIGGASGHVARLCYLVRPMAPATPEHFGDYELVERLGVGGMAETFVAIRRGPGGFELRVCLKRILPTFAGDADFVEMFLRAALRHLRGAENRSTLGSRPTSRTRLHPHSTSRTPQTSTATPPASSTATYRPRMCC